MLHWFGAGPVDFISGQMCIRDSCAAYVKYNYHGDDALENPIFMRANRILAAGWEILYILIAIWSAFLLSAGHTTLMQILNNMATVLMGIFTGWFEKWYPQRVAAGK